VLPAVSSRRRPRGPGAGQAGNAGRKRPPKLPPATPGNRQRPATPRTARTDRRPGPNRLSAHTTTSTTWRHTARVPTCALNCTDEDAGRRRADRGCVAATVLRTDCSGGSGLFDAGETASVEHRGRDRRTWLALMALPESGEPHRRVGSVPYVGLRRIPGGAAEWAGGIRAVGSQAPVQVFSVVAVLLVVVQRQIVAEVVVRA